MIPIRFIAFFSLLITLSLGQRLAMDRHVLFDLTSIVLLSSMHGVRDGRYAFEISLGYTRRLVESCQREGIRKAIVGTEAMNPYLGWLFSNRKTNPLLYSCMEHLILLCI